ncbi:MAG: hypothetical protein IPP77_00140 [Bacteroidetes bacterium]|nr:hypothetical protein [Bacteroidota bacterium]
MVVDAGIDTAVCTGSSVTLGGSTVANGGTGNYTYSWSPPSGLNSTSIANPIVQNVTTNSCYTIFVTDSLGCISSDVICIAARLLPIANAGPDVTIYACAPDSAVLGGNPTATGTVGPYTYLWFPSFNVALNDFTVANPILDSLGQNTQLCVTVADAFGCKATDCLNAATLPNTLFANAKPSNLPAVCSGSLSCVTLGATISLSGGSPPYSYQWSGGTDPIQGIPNPNVCPTVTTTYLLIGTDSRGCQSSDTVQVKINTSPVASISGLNTNYCANAPNVTLTGSPLGGTFSGPCVTGNIFQPACVGAGNTACIKYSYTDPATGCADDTTICIMIDLIPVAAIAGGDKPGGYCKSESDVTLTGTPVGGTFSGTGVSSTGLFTPANAVVGNNVITYTFTSQGGCVSSAQITIPVKATPTLTISATADSVCAGQLVTISAIYSLDVTNIQWYKDFASFPFASGLNPATFTAPDNDFYVDVVAVNSSSLCEARDTVFVHVIKAPTAQDDSASTCEERPISISVLTNDSNFESSVATISILNPWSWFQLLYLAPRSTILRIRTLMVRIQ